MQRDLKKLKISLVCWKMKINQILILFLLFNFTNVMSIEPDEILKDAQLEQRAREISSVLRCMVCQNENIDNSNAGIARDLRILIREELVAGKTNSQIINFVHGKYGDYVLFKPPLKFYTLFLWISPFVIFFFLFLLFFRKNKID